ncbi:ABC transporter ATP-binding protein [Actinomyces sp.]
MSEPILSARGVSFRYPGSDAGLDDVSVEVRAGESVALVGESGSGKTTLARVLLAPSAGEVLLDGEAVRASSTASMRTLRRSVQTVFQDPFSSLDPRMTIGASIAEPLHALGVSRGEAASARVREVLTDVGIDPARAGEYPGSFSGGQRQRIAIARALAPAPRVLIADEPVSALDMSTRASVMDLLGSITRERGMALVLVSHDLATVASTCDRIAVMQQGRIVEAGETVQIMSAPREPYTRALIEAVPRL